MKRMLLVLVAMLFLQQAVLGETAQQVAHRKARTAAKRGYKGHVGGGLGGARFEGVGWGTSPQLAIRKCCYFGRKLCVAQAVYKGRDGLYYACRLYR